MAIMVSRFAAVLLFTFSAFGTDLEHRIDQLVESSPASAHAIVGVSVIQLSSGKPIYRRNDDRLLLPASNMKLLTSAMALQRLGPDYKFTTKLMLEPSGDLALLGSGDPSLSGRVFPYDKDAAAGPGLQAIDDLADQAVKSGITRIDGDIVGDDRLYPWAPYAPSWTQDDALREFGAPVSALTINENVLTLLIRPGGHPGDPATVEINPALEYYAIDNRLITIAPSPDARVRISRANGSRQILLWGSIPAGHGALAETLAIDDPALYAACALYNALTRRGIVVSGKPVARHRTTFEDEDPPSGNIVASRQSPPLGQLLQVMDKVSQNLFAELMLREVGRATHHMGTRDAGLDELAAFLAEIGVPKDDARVEDGSGLARNAMVTPRLLTKLLAFMHAAPRHDDFIAMLPIGGEDGTLRRRFADASSKAAGAIRAKTGSLARALALSGYAESKTYGPVAFSIIVNDFSAPQSEVRAMIDKIAVALLD